jgi:tetratricopeptide (TPR) repeat protein
VRTLGPSAAVIGAAVFCSLLFPRASHCQQDSLSNEVRLQVIVVRSSEEAGRVVERLKKGEDFGRIAKEESIDPTAEADGFMGQYALSALRAELRDALKGVGEGQFSPVVHIPSGYAILKIMSGKDDPGNNAADPARNFGMGATGTVKYVNDVGGISEAEVVLQRFPKASNWNEDAKNICELRKQSLTDAIARMKDLLANGPPPGARNPSSFDIMETHFALAQLYAYGGNMDPAIEEYKVSYQLALSSAPTAIPQMEAALGIIYLHKSGMENDVFRAPGEKCLFPVRPGNGYQKTDDSNLAIGYFLKYLEKKPEDLEVKWLLNLAYMTVGKYPSGVPEKYLLPPVVFESKEDVGRFVDVASDAGLNIFSTAGGIIVDDFENNGLLDVVTSGFESCGPMHYFHNNGDGTFTERTKEAGLAGMVGGLNLLQTDYNNDGCLDILVLRGAWEFPQPRSLLRNNCNGTFTDVTAGSGLEKPVSSQAAVWVDINNDGLLDLFAGNESGPTQLFLNKGDGTFEDISFASGVGRDANSFSKGVAAADYDNDGYADLYVSNLTGRGFLFHNNHDKTFTEVALKAGVPGTGRGFATWFFDYDNDGFPDLFTTSYFASVDETMRTYLDLPHNAQTLKLYKNLGDGTFRDVTQEVGLDKVYMPMGANFGDIDNDGYLDIYLGTGNPSYASDVPNVLLRNHDGKYFVDVTTSSGTGELHKGHAIAFADLGNNGNEDIVTVIGGATPGDSHALRIFKNPGHDNDWITVKLVGVKTNRVAIGARIKVTVENQGQGTRSIYRSVGSGGSFGASPLQQHIGLGKSARIVNLEIDWPASKTKQVFSDVQKNQFLEITEFAKTYKQLDRKPFRLGAAKNGVTAGSNLQMEAPAAKN